MYYNGIMDKRKELILNAIIKEHIKIGAPVGSGVLVDKYKLKVSPATVRNEMAELEEEGFIIQPHTSAGRIPTEKAYNLYLDNLSVKGGERKISGSEAANFEKLLKAKDEMNFKQAAKEMARVSSNAIFWAFHKHNLYYTGISNLLQQPEFFQSDLIYDISLVIDRVDEVINEIFDDVRFETSVMLGADNPFSDHCSTVLAKYKINGKIGMFGILGPVRMDYEKNLALVDFISKKIENKNV